MLKNKKGIFIVFEGIDGAGKDHQIRLLNERLLSRGFETVITSEPWSSEEGKRLRKLAREGRGNLTPSDEAELFFRDRQKHVKNVILPALEAGKIVLCSRYYYSTMAYQGALGADIEAIRKKNENAFPMPDLVLMFKIDVKTALKRINDRSHTIDIAYEKKEYLEKVAKILYSISDSNIYTIDAKQPPERVFEHLNKLIENLRL